MALADSEIMAGLASRLLTKKAGARAGTDRLTPRSMIALPSASQNSSDRFPPYKAQAAAPAAPVVNENVTPAQPENATPAAGQEDVEMPDACAGPSLRGNPDQLAVSAFMLHIIQN